MFKPFASLVLVVLCAACGSSFDASAAGGAAGVSGAGTAAGDSSGGDTSAAGSLGAGSGGSGEAGAGATSSAGASGTTTGSGGWTFGTGGGHFGGFGNYGGFGGSATAGGSGGSGGTDCATLKTEYAAAVQKARVCDMGSTDECSPSSTLSAVGCGCPVLINANSPSKAVAEEKYKQIQANKCETGAICNIACLPDTGAGCAAQATGSDSVCTATNAAAAN